MPEENANRCASDVELVRRIRRGDDEAFGVLLDRHAGRLYGLAVSLLGSAVDAEDVVQDTFAAAVRGLGGFRGHASVKTWLTRILVNRAAKVRRSRRLRATEPIDVVLEGRGAVAEGPASVRTEIRIDVAAVLAALSEEHRAVVVLREMQGMSYNEIADALAIPRGTVESRLFRARQRLRELLKDYLP